MPSLELRESGFYCPAGDFYIDPWSPVDRAVITHAHSEHACPGSTQYLTSAEGADLLRELVGHEAAVQSSPYGESLTLGDVRLSLQPAGHIAGSSQVRLENRGEVTVFSGDYNLERDPTCAPFEPIACHTFFTEATFALPIFRWQPDTIDAIHGWWRANQEAGKASLLFAHPIGMAQRLLAGLDPSIGPIHAHPEVERYTEIYRRQGISLPPTAVTPISPSALVVAPPSARGTDWVKQFGAFSDALASGWMRIRGARRRRSLDRGFVISNHADWAGILQAIEATGAETIYVTHGHRGALVRWLQEQGRSAFAVESRFEEPQS